MNKEREAFVSWLADDEKSGVFPSMEGCWKAACAYQRGVDAEIIRKGPFAGTRESDALAILNQGSKE